MGVPFVEHSLFIASMVLILLWLLLSVLYCVAKRRTANFGEHTFKLKELKLNTNEFGVSYSELTIGHLLGKGSQGEVYKAMWRGSVLAVKKIDTRACEPEVVEEFCQEAEIMRKLRHPCLTLFMGVSLENPHLCILTELVACGSLFDILRDKSKSRQLTWKRGLQIVSDVAHGMSYLHGHSPPILHRDLKSLNILVTETWRGKVADFGMTTFDRNDDTMTQCGSPLWMSPEMIRNEVYDEKSDVYSFAICMWEVYTHKVPYEQKIRMGSSAIIAKVVRENMRPDVPSTMPEAYVNLMMKCWHPDPRQRPTFKSIIADIDKIRDNKAIVNHVPGSDRKHIVHSEEEKKVMTIVTEGDWTIDPDLVQLTDAMPTTAEKYTRDNSVHRAMYREQQVVVKIFKISSSPWTGSPQNQAMEDITEDLVTEYSRIRHPNLVLFVGAFTQTGLLAVVSENMSNGGLSRVTHNLNNSIDWDTQMQFLIGAAEAMTFLHMANPPIIHKDLQTKRLLLDKHFRVKVSDCMFVDLEATIRNRERGMGGSNPNSLNLPSAWTPPEAFGDPFNVTRAGNVYSFAYIVWEVMTRQRLWGGDYYDMQRVERARAGDRPHVPMSTPPRLVQLLNNMWHGQAQKRPSFKQILDELRAIKLDGPTKMLLRKGVNANLYRKAVVVTAYKSKDAITVIKPWGESIGNKGCYIVSSNNNAEDNDVYTCEDEVFKNSYESVGVPEFHQYRKKGSVLARLMHTPFSIKSEEGILEHGMPGDFLVQNDKGAQWPVPGSSFTELYVLDDGKKSGSGGARRSTSQSVGSEGEALLRASKELGPIRAPRKERRSMAELPDLYS